MVILMKTNNLLINILNFLTVVSVVLFIATLYLVTKSEVFFSPLVNMFISSILFYFTMITFPALFILGILIIIKDHSVESFQALVTPFSIMIASSLFGSMFLMNLRDGLYYVVSNMPGIS